MVLCPVAWLSQERKTCPRAKLVPKLVRNACQRLTTQYARTAAFVLTAVLFELVYCKRWGSSATCLPPRNRPIGCHYTGTGCHYTGTGCHYTGTGCHYTGTGCHYTGTGCHYTGTGCHYTGTGCHYTGTGCHYTGTGCHYTGTGCHYTGTGCHYMGTADIRL